MVAGSMFDSIVSAMSADCHRFQTGSSRPGRAGLAGPDGPNQAERIPVPIAELNRLSQERRALFEQAEERTKQILTPKQRARYEELLKKRGGPGRRGPRPQTPPHAAGERQEMRPGEPPGPPPGPMSGEQ